LTLLQPALPTSASTTTFLVLFLPPELQNHRFANYDKYDLISRD
jgi:hypothetical protein